MAQPPAAAIRVESEPGRGSVFSVLPWRWRPRRGLTGRRRRRARPAAGRGHALLADDSARRAAGDDAAADPRRAATSTARHGRHRRRWSFYREAWREIGLGAARRDDARAVRLRGAGRDAADQPDGLRAVLCSGHLLGPGGGADRSVRGASGSSSRSRRPTWRAPWPPPCGPLAPGCSGGRRAADGRAGRVLLAVVGGGGPRGAQADRHPDPAAEEAARREDLRC
ncbi:MAG: hypothetical protein MZV63_05985 [Marinilabiliales bacterium]|nr:hypothetical protein [Marinilabiliales bacterium]